MLFNKIYGAIPTMIQSDSISLQKMLERITENEIPELNNSPKLNEESFEIEDQLIGVISGEKEISELSILSRLGISPNDHEERKIIQIALGKLLKKELIQTGDKGGYSLKKNN